MKNCIRDTVGWQLFSFAKILSSFHEKLMHFFLFQKSLRIKKFESRTILFELYCPFRKHWSVFINVEIANLDQDKIWSESFIWSKLFLLLKTFLKTFNQGQSILLMSIWVDSYCPFSKLWLIFAKIAYNSIHVEFCNDF